MAALKAIDRIAFFVTVVSGAIAAVAGWYNWPVTAVISGCTACFVPIINRVTAAQERRMAGPRTLSERQRKSLLNSLGGGPFFEVWIAHNRHEAEPSEFHRQVFETIGLAGLTAQWFGGMTNSTSGVEISGPPSPEKVHLMKAFKLARIPFLEVELTDAPTGPFAGIGIWIGVNPGLA